MIKVQFTDIDVASKWLEHRCIGGPEQSLAETAQRVFDMVDAAADAHTTTGALARSLDIVRVSANHYEIGHDLAEAPHALFVHWGTKPHVIRPKGASLATQRELYGPDGTQRKLTAAGKLKAMPGGRKLVLRWAAGGKFVFSQHVNHPGYAGDAYLVRAAAQVPKIFHELVAARLARE